MELEDVPVDPAIYGRCKAVVNHATGDAITCVDVTFYDQAANTATFTGTAEVNGTLLPYTAQAADNAEPGEGADSFTITIGGVTHGGTLTAGNVQVHD